MTRRKPSTRAQGKKAELAAAPGVATRSSSQKRARSPAENPQASSKKPRVLPRPVPKPTKPGVVGQQRQQTPELTPRTAKLRGLVPLPRKFLQPLPGSDEDNGPSSESDAAQNLSSTEGSDEEEDLNSLGAAQLKSALDSERIQIGGTSRASQRGDTFRGFGRTSNHHSEVPQWKPSDGPGSDSEEADAELPETIVYHPGPKSVNATWPPEAHYTPAKPGSRHIGLYAQPPALQAVMRAGIRTAIERATVSGFFRPSGDYAGICSMLQDISLELDFGVLAARFEEDDVFAREVSRVISHRIALRRGTAKTIANGTVGARYGLEMTNIPETCKRKAEALLLGSRYIFPEQENGGGIVNTQPYEHPCVVYIIRKFLFEGSRLPHGEHHLQIFKSGFNRYPNQLEVPIPVVALVATAIHASISDWLTGVHRPSDFTADIVEDVYEGHKDWLDSMRTREPAKLHVLLHKLYNRCSPGISAASTGIVDGINNMVNLDGMEDISEGA